MQATRSPFMSRRMFVAGTLATGAILGVRGIASAASAPPALFVAAHPDDETLAMGVAIAEHVAAGQDVHVLWLTAGTKSSARRCINGEWTSVWWRVRHTPADEGYAPLDEATFGQARIGEARRAVAALTTGLSGDITVHEGGLVDGTVTVPQAAATILELCDLIAPGSAMRIKTHSHVVDNHPDHLAAGAAVVQLAAQQPSRFGNRRHYILPAYWTDLRLSKVAESWDWPTDVGIRDRVINACRAFSAWAPPHSYAVGYHSTSALFAQIVAAPKCLLHA